MTETIRNPGGAPHWERTGGAEHRQNKQNRACRLPEREKIIKSNGNDAKWGWLTGLGGGTETIRDPGGAPPLGAHGGRRTPPEQAKPRRRRTVPLAIYREGEFALKHKEK